MSCSNLQITTYLSITKTLTFKNFQVEQKHMLIMVLIVLNYQIKVSFILS